jgi:hypothetical protein
MSLQHTKTEFVIFAQEDVKKCTKLCFYDLHKTSAVSCFVKYISVYKQLSPKYKSYYLKQKSKPK